MFNSYQTLLQNLSTPEALPLLAKIQRGIEKEGLRVTAQAKVAQTKHPQILGSALTHPSITTDYSEALLEFITPVSTAISDSINYLSNLHIYTARNNAAEYIWPASMPCRLEGEESIPIAQYGSSNIGRMKHVYRQGLALRYGKTMQSIAGIHYNFSMPDAFWPLLQQLSAQQGDLQDFKSERYFGLIRNFQRHSWLLTYLFGASPVLDRSFFNSTFMGNQQGILEPQGENTLGLPYATSLRMSDLGYQSKAQNSLDINYNNLDEYLENLQAAMQAPYDDYEKLGVKIDGKYRQLNSNILQIENEYYSGIRPKRVPVSGEISSETLRREGVEYVEIRTLDINPFLLVGLDEEQIRVLDSFLLYCLLSDSAEISSKENNEIQSNLQKVILEGRNPALILQQGGREISFVDKAKTLLNKISGSADLLDRAHLDSAHLASAHSNTRYSAALAQQLVKIEHPEQTPSGIIMADIVNGFEFSDLMLKQAKRQQQYFSTQPLSYKVEKELQQQALLSLQQQKDLESQDADAHNASTFEAFLNASQPVCVSSVEQQKVVGSN
ncbi:MAG: glutamate--cysteine ligase [Oleispira sp.]|nr:glutamate--cysteine ligase [Oleispira sp.]MBL4881636.1 glutamate--cysteine ligase [Oleispira sp.]